MLETMGLTITESQLTAVEAALAEMMEAAKAACILLVNSSDGSLIAAQGRTDELDTVSLGALAVGAFASTQEIARLVGEPEFTMLFHEGKRHHVHVNIAGEHTLLMTLFTDDTTVGMVRLCARKAAHQIQRALP
jgi:predicted regulator of Ras-like GTPase activity (Roadblock/LC7/MglB family)